MENRAEGGERRANGEVVMKRGMVVNFKTYEKFLGIILEQLRESFGVDVVLSFALFGSVARGTAGPESDIDVLIVHEEVDFRPTKRFVEVLMILRRHPEYLRLRDSGFLPDPYPVFMTEKELWERPHILLDILDDGIIIYDTGVLRRRLETLRSRLSELGAKKVNLEDGTWYWDLKPDWKPGEVITL